VGIRRLSFGQLKGGGQIVLEFTYIDAIKQIGTMKRGGTE
jgi:hypothetical protein